MSDYISVPDFFESLLAKNKLAKRLGFVIRRVSGFDGFEQAVDALQERKPFLAISDVVPVDFSVIDSAPHDAEAYTIFFAIPYRGDDMKAREEKLQIIRELLRQFLSRLIQEKTKLDTINRFLHQTVRLVPAPKYAFASYAVAHATIVLELYSDLRYNDDEWEE